MQNNYPQGKEMCNIKLLIMAGSKESRVDQRLHGFMTKSTAPWGWMDTCMFWTEAHSQRAVIQRGQTHAT